MYEGGELRKRTKLAPVKENTKRNNWIDDNGKFYDYQRKFMDNFPGSRFENEYCEDGIAECSLTGYTGSIGQLTRWQTRRVKFEVCDGRVNVRYDPNKSETLMPNIKVDPVVAIWVISAIATVVFLVFNLDSYLSLIF
jgi:hypothetical protein